LSDSRVRLTAVTLDEEGRKVLLSILGAGAGNHCAEPLVEHVVEIGGRFMLIEEPYIDRDYSADFVAFYSAAFKAYPRHTRRIHFFLDDVSTLFEHGLAEQAVAKAEKLGYLGFVVIRPIRQGPVGRTMLPFPKFASPLIARHAVRSKVEPHLLATKLEATGAPFIQQDRRTGACAQAAIWMANRPIYERHHQSSWHSVSQITRYATTPTDADLSKSLPHGSSGLNPLHITRALRAMGHQPYCNIFEKPITSTEPGTDPAEDAQSDREASAIADLMRYLDSGLPVILGVRPQKGEPDGHAVTAVGYVEDKGPAIRHGDGYDRFVRAILVHDDQRGPYRLMAVTKADVDFLAQQRLMKANDDVLTVENAVSHIFVPLSQRVFLIADYANIIAFDFLERKVADLRDSLIDQIAQEAPTARSILEDFCDKFEEGRIVRRTYLTTAARYRHHLSKTQAPEELKIRAVSLMLPHFVYVTELVEEDALPDENDARPIVGHLLFNATSSTDPNADLLFAHLPYLAVERDINLEPDNPDSERISLIREHQRYAQRLRR
jgi:hypothetical protein